MNISQHLDKNNLHHAYLIEGARDEIVPEIIKFLKSLDINTVANPDFYNISIDNFKIDEAFDLRAMSTDKSFSTARKIFIIYANSFSLDAQNVLLKMFEEPIESTHFFIIVPDTKALLKTFVSRFYLISARQPARQLAGGDLAEDTQQVEKFITMPLKNRIDFIKELLTEAEEDPEGNEIIALDSTRAKALKFLNELEFVLHKKMSKSLFGIKIFEHIFKVREFLRMPGSSTKTLMESVALVTPIML